MRENAPHLRALRKGQSVMGPTVRANIGCQDDSSLITSTQKQRSVLDQQAIIPNSASRKLLDLVASGEMTCELLCHREDDPQGGPFLMLVRVTLQDQRQYASLLTTLSGDSSLAELFELQGPVYLRILRCRRDAWKDLKQCFGAALGQQSRPSALLP
jgi:hypothetical protein